MAIVAGKKTTKLTYEDFLTFPSDGRRHELIEGEHFVSASPETNHQSVTGGIFVQLHVQIEQPKHGKVFIGPTDLKLSLIDIVVPDILVVLNRRKRVITPKLIDGPPDLVVEVLSRSTARRDRTRKKKLYRRSGIPEYWLVDPKKRIVEQYILRGGAYVLAGTHREKIIYQQLPDVVVDLTAVW